MNVTELAVADGKIDNEQLGEFTKKCFEIYERIRRGSLRLGRVLVQLQLILEGRGIDYKVTFPMWREIDTGTFKYAAGLVDAIYDAKFKIGTHALGMMQQEEHFKLDELPKRTQLVKAKLVEIGFPTGATYFQIIERIKELGHKLCTPETAAQLRLQYTDQPQGETAFFAMEPLPLDPEHHKSDERAIFSIGERDFLFPQLIHEKFVYYDHVGWCWIFQR